MTLFNFNTIRLLERLANFAILLGIIGVLLMALFFQFFEHELPCPLCLLQRVGFVCMTFGLLLNIRFGCRPSHYAMILLSGLFTSFVALRQIALHIIPGTGTYGEAFLGYHLYTWSFIFAIAIVIFVAMILGIDRQYFTDNALSRSWKAFFNLVIFLVAFTVMVNVIVVFLQCGIDACDDNPTHYKMLSKI